MSGWIPILRAVIPHLAPLVAAAAPAFTVKQGMVAQQIAELQHAVGSNARSIKDLAGQLQQVARVLEELSAANQAAVQQLRQTRLIALSALAVAAVAVIVAIVAILAAT